MIAVDISLNAQQEALLAASVQSGEASNLDSLVARAVRELSSGKLSRLNVPVASASDRHWQTAIEFAPDDERTTLAEYVLSPGTGRAILVSAGDVVRIQQIDGNQCVDLNVFSLHDYREAFDAGRTRTLHGINPTQGDFLWSAPPRERELMYVLNDTTHCNDVMFPRCSANLYETRFGFLDHTNCADIQAEAQREFGLTPDDVHDSFNLFMATEVRNGIPIIKQQSTSPGDYVELVALMDLLVVPNVCGSDVLPTSNFAIRDILVRHERASAQDIDRVPPMLEYASQRDVSQFRQPVIRAERKLLRDPLYVPEFTNVPLQLTVHEVALAETDAMALDELWDRDRYPSRSEALRDAVFTWWMQSHAR